MAEKYLTEIRNLKHFANADIRFIDEISTYHGDNKTTSSALIAFSRDEKGEVNHAQVTRLNPKTGDKDSASNCIKQTYGSVNGCYVELNKNHKSNETFITEGVETGLSILEKDANARVISTLGKSNFLNVKLGDLGGNITFCFDNDGQETYRNKTLTDAIIRAEKAGLNVSVILPSTVGDDLNDVLKNGGQQAIDDAIKAKITGQEFIKACVAQQKIDLKTLADDTYKIDKTATNDARNLVNDASKASYEPSINTDIRSVNITNPSDKIRQMPPELNKERELEL